jgi:tetratricopeptide (TPR) repeat protein
MKLTRQKKPPATGSSVNPAPVSSKNSDQRGKIFAISLVLAVMTFIVYGRTLHYEFVDYDDNVYVYDNPVVSAGLTLKGIAWAFGHYQTANWVPLTLVSHMLDCQFYKLNAGGHHLTNVLLHTASVILLFLVLRQMTSTLWRSAFVAAVFAVHPLHVESVAWVAERKDVLSGFFFMLALWAYVRYVRKPESLSGYLMVLLLFALGLLSKPMLVTLPLILLLLDYWPLNRFSKQPLASIAWMKNLSIPARLIIEKIPLLLLSIVFCLLTVFAQSPEMMPLKGYPFPLRVSNALVSCVIYLEEIFHPANLAPFYPYPASVPLYESAAALILLAVISLAAVFWRQKRPYLLVGWLWYLIMLVPVIGILQVGYQARADRYTYLPEIGLYVLIAWLLVELGTRLRNHRVILAAGTTLFLAALMVNASTQTEYWRNSESLWSRALACTQNNYIAHNNLGLALAQKGDLDDAEAHFQKALAIYPYFAEAYNNLGDVCYDQRQWDNAIFAYQKAAEIKPDNTEIENNLGLAYAQNGQLDEAIVCFQKAVAIDPDYPDARENLRLALSQKGQAGAPVPSR